MDLSSFRDDFLAEADELLARLSKGFVEIEGLAAGTPDHQSQLDAIYRDFHSLKGMSAMMGFEGLTALSHVAEDALDAMRGGRLHTSAEAVDALLVALDRLEQMVEDVRREGAGELAHEDVRERLQHLLDAPAPEASASQPSASTKKESVADEESSRTSAPSRGRRGLGASESTVRVGVERLDDLLDLVGEVVIARNRLVSVLETAEATNAGTTPPPQNETSELEDILGGLNRLISDLQEQVLSVRMLPVDSVLGRLPRYARDLARDLGKQCEVVISGGATELDRAVLERLKDPLGHIVRNAIDHGIEPPAERQQLAKPPAGTLSLSASSEENSIILEIGDDGRGIDPERVRQVALDREVITPEIADRMSTSDLVQLIFEPGFSTTETISDVSGRGVGMDVVRASIEDLGGQVEVDSVPGRSCTFRIRLPLTLAIVGALKVVVGDETYGVPLPAIVETYRLDRESLRTIAGRTMAVYRDGVLPVIPLRDLFAPPGLDEIRPDTDYAVIVAFGGRRGALIVDRLAGQEEVVIKSLGAYLRGGCQGLGGATVLGDGRVMLMLDIGALLDLATRGEYLMGSR